jgi:hypothetical protein
MPEICIKIYLILQSTCGATFAWGTALIVGRSRVRFPMVSLESFIDTMAPGVDSASNRNEYQEYFLGGGGVKAAGA